MIDFQRFVRTCLFAMTGLFFCLPQASAVSSNSVTQANTTVQLVPQYEQVVPGQTFWIGLKMTMAPEWHVYWRNAGDSGFPPTVSWNAPELQIGEAQWPYPQRISIPPLTSYGYEREVALFFPVTAESKTQGEQTIDAMVQWLACRIECVPGTARLTLPIQVHPSEKILNREFQAIESGLSKVPVPLSGWDVDASLEDRRLMLFVHPERPNDKIAGPLYFFPDSDQWIDHSAEQVLKETREGYQLTVPLASIADSSLEQVSGILVAENGWPNLDGRQAVQFEAPVLIGKPISPISPGPRSISIPLALAFAFLGGLILNLMPCVLPVLSIKVLHLMEMSSQNRLVLLRHGLSFTFGILVMFWLLAAVLLVLKSFGRALGWGFQFQSPVFLIAMAILFVVFALNMFGLIEIGTVFTRAGSISSAKRGYRSSFLSGLLATIVATPCTAPFMGTALGVALISPSVVAFLIFTFLGLGMALPFLMATLFPSVLKLIPKPGKWMLTMKKIFGVMFLLTAAWLFWVLAAQISSRNDSAFEEQKSGIRWRPFSQTAVDRALSEGHPVFIDFTAKWCLTCQVNDRVALNQEEVVRRFEEVGIVPFKADWTNYDKNITSALAQYGKSSIPFYVYYPNGNDGEVVFLPEILTPGIVLKFLDQNPVE